MASTLTLLRPRVAARGPVLGVSCRPCVGYPPAHECCDPDAPLRRGDAPAFAHPRGRVMETILVVVPVVLALSGIVAAFFLGGHKRPAAPRHRPTKGTVQRFDSVTKLVEHCRKQYGTDHVRTLFEGRDFVVQVDLTGGQSFEALIVEGESSYAALLPDGSSRPDR